MPVKPEENAGEKLVIRLAELDSFQRIDSRFCEGFVVARDGIEPSTFRFSVGRCRANRQHRHAEFSWCQRDQDSGFQVRRRCFDRVDDLLPDVARQRCERADLNDTGQVIATQRQERTKVKILRDDDPLALTREVEDFNVGCIRSPYAALVLHLMTYLCEDITPQRRQVHVQQDSHAGREISTSSDRQAA
jgi:hypothetical protein